MERELLTTHTGTADGSQDPSGQVRGTVTILRERDREGRVSRISNLEGGRKHRIWQGGRVGEVSGYKQEGERL